MIQELLAALQASDAAVALRKSFWVYPLVNAGHIFGLALIFGAILPLDLRLLGFRSGMDWRQLAAVLTPVAMAGVLLTLITGLALFSARPLDYVFKPLFQIKLLFVALAILNALLLRTTAAWQTADGTAPVPARLKLAAIISISGWIAAILCGRLVGYY